MPPRQKLSHLFSLNSSIRRASSNTSSKSLLASIVGRGTMVADTPFTLKYCTGSGAAHKAASSAHIAYVASIYVFALAVATPSTVVGEEH